MKETAIVVLNINPDEDDYKNYKSLTSQQKIDYITQRIEAIAQQLQQTEPASQWLITWREYGIFGLDTKFITNQDKNYLKNKFKELTSKYPQLLIISGTVATKKTLKNHDKAKSILKYYQDNALIMHTREEQGVLHLKKLQHGLSNFDPNVGLEVIRNTSYLFAKGECIGRYDKTMPYQESADQKNLQNDFVFQPGNKQRNNGLFTETGHDRSLSIGIEICREHAFGIFKNTLVNNQLKEPNLHLVLAEGMALHLEHIYGENILLVDSSSVPALLVPKQLTDEELAAYPMKLYENNLLQSSKQITKLRTLHYGIKDLLIHLTDLQNYVNNHSVQDKVLILSIVRQMRLLLFEAFRKDRPIEQLEKSVIKLMRLHFPQPPNNELELLHYTNIEDKIEEWLLKLKTFSKVAKTTSLDSKQLSAVNTTKQETQIATSEIKNPQAKTKSEVAEKTGFKAFSDTPIGAFLSNDFKFSLEQYIQKKREEMIAQRRKGSLLTAFRSPPPNLSINKISIDKSPMYEKILFNLKKILAESQNEFFMLSLEASKKPGFDFARAVTALENSCVNELNIFLKKEFNTNMEEIIQELKDFSSTNLTFRRNI